VRATRTLLLFSALWACGSPQQLAGSGSQTGNSVVAGRILASDSTAGASEVMVYLRPLSWTSGQPIPAAGFDSTRTNSLGDYQFTRVPLDTYRVEARLDDSGWSRTVRATSPWNQVSIGALHKLGRLKMEVDLTDSTRGGEVDLYGLDRSLAIPDTGVGDESIDLYFDSLPVGLQTVRYWSKGRDFGDTSVRIYPDSTTYLDDDDMNGGMQGPDEDP